MVMICVISVSKSVEYTSTIIQLLNLSFDNAEDFQVLSCYTRIRPLLGLAAHKNFNKHRSCFEKYSESQIRPKHTSTCSDTVLVSHEAAVCTFPSVLPEAVEDTFFLFSSWEGEAGCDTSSLLDMPGAN